MKSKPIKSIIGYYNEIYYTVCELHNGQIIKEHYKAGNNPLAGEYDQSLPADEGIGIDKMKEYCELTSKSISEEQKLEFIGVEYEEPDSPSC